MTVTACLLGSAFLAFSQAQKPASTTQRVLGLNELYGGLEATRVLPKGGVLVFDTRSWKEASHGRIVTDVIDLAGGGVLDEDGAATQLKIAVDATIPARASVAAEVRTGATYFQAPGTWSEWRPANDVVEPTGRYAQLRLDLAAGDPKLPPSVKSVTLSYRLRRTARAGSVKVVADNVQRIVQSPVSFGYERQDQADLVWMRKTFQLDGVIAGKKTEFEQLHALMHWAATRHNERPGPWDAKKQPYPWNIRQVMTEAAGGTVYGHCMSYCEVMVTAAGAFGWQGRHWAIHGVRDTSHEVPEIWINELGKWVFFDPSLDTYYADQQTREPLNLLEMHNLYLKTVFKPSEIQRMGRTVNEDRLTKLRGKHPILCITGDYTYGVPAKWDWEWDHGYMTAGWMQLTPRNNWHSQPEPAYRYFGEGPDGYGGFPLYLDDQTPVPGQEASLWYTRKRDFWWTLNQASLRLVHTGASSLRVECGNSQPFFKRYLAKRGDGDWKPVEERFIWTLKPGDNRLDVVSEDQFGKRGIASAITVRYAP